MGDDSTAEPTGILALWNDCKTNKESLYEHWYQSEHLQDRVSIPGFKLGRRHQSSDATPNTLPIMKLLRLKYCFRRPTYTSWITHPY